MNKEQRNGLLIILGLALLSGALAFYLHGVPFWKACIFVGMFAWGICAPFTKLHQKAFVGSISMIAMGIGEGGAAHWNLIHQPMHVYKMDAIVGAAIMIALFPLMNILHWLALHTKRASTNSVP